MKAVKDTLAGMIFAKEENIMKKNLFKVLAVAAAATMLITVTAAAHGGHGRYYTDANNDGVCDYCNGEGCGNCGEYCGNYGGNYGGGHHGGYGHGHGGYGCR